jgi:hypothetical protein
MVCSTRFWFQSETREIKANIVSLGSEKMEFLLVSHQSKTAKILSEEN